MGVKGSRKAYAVVLGLALAGLVIDRLVLGTGVTGPRGAEADAAMLVVAPDAALNAAITPSVVTVAERLSGLENGLADGEVPNGFGGNPAWLKPAPVVDAPTHAAEAIPFAKRYRLAAIMSSGERSKVRLVAIGTAQRQPRDAELLGVGDSQDGMMLVEIDAAHRIARFDGPEGSVELEINSTASEKR